MCALTAGPGVTNGMSAMASALDERLADGRARRARAGDALGPGLAPGDRPRAVRRAGDEAGAHGAIPPPRSPASWTRRCACRSSRPAGPTFVDFPLDQVFMEAEADADGPGGAARSRRSPAADGDAIERAADLLRVGRAPGDHGRHRPLLGATASTRSSALCEELRIPVFLNGLARGCVPPDHDCYFSRARGTALKGADVALVIGVPMDFRLGFGGSFGEDTKIVVIGSAPPAAPASARGRGGAVRRRAPRRSTRCARAPPAVPTARAGSPSCARSRTSAAPPSRTSSPTTARRSTRCASTTSCGRCSTANDDRDRRRRRLRLLRRPGDRDLRARLLDGPGPVRLPRRGPGLRARGEARAPGPRRSACCSATAPSASRASSSTRWCATTCRSSP